MSETKCPMCNCNLSDVLACPECKREWVLTGDREAPLTSKPRRVRLVKQIREGEKLDDCIKPFRK